MISDCFLIFDLVDYSVSIKLALKCYRQCGKKVFQYILDKSRTRSKVDIFSINKM